MESCIPILYDFWYYDHYVNIVDSSNIVDLNSNLIFSEIMQVVNKIAFNISYPFINLILSVFFFSIDFISSEWSIILYIAFALFSFIFGLSLTIFIFGRDVNLRSILIFDQWEGLTLIKLIIPIKMLMFYLFCTVEQGPSYSAVRWKETFF